MHRLFPILLTVGSFALACRASVGEEVTASELSERVSTTSRAIKNASFTVTWNDSIDGTLRQYSVVKIVYDSLGRIRITETEKGSYDAAGKKVSSRKGRSDKLFDGEKSIVLNTHKDLDDGGKPIVAPGEDGVVRNAVIADAMDGTSRWRTADRNPLRNNPRHLLVRLDVLAGLGQAVDLRPTKYEGEEAVVVRFQQGERDVTATLDPKRSWSLRDLVEKDSMGNTTKHYHAEFADSKEGLWLPLRGTTMSFHERKAQRVLKPPKVDGGKPEIVVLSGGTPKIEKHNTGFELSNLVVNDPKFDESVFSISLPTETRVSDLRYKSLYRIGEAKATDAELRRLALLAREDPESARKATSIGRKVAQNQNVPRTLPSIIWMTLGSLVLGAVLLIAVVRARRAYLG